MKRKLFLLLSVVALAAFMLALSVSASVTVYDDAPQKTVLITSTDDVVKFKDGFTCPSAYIFKDRNTTDEGHHTGTDGLYNTIDFSYINEKTGKIYGVSDIEELDIPEGFVEIKKYGFTRVGFTKVSIPKTVTAIGSCAFEKCASLQECVFEHDENSNFKTLSDWIFQGTALTAISLPDCIEQIQGNCHFAKCSNLTAVYLPKKLTTYTTSVRDGESSFYFCKNMYLVNEPFTYDNVPAKPQIYYFPSGLSNMSGESFKICANLNEIIVFPEALTSFTNSWAFETNNYGTTLKHIVFLGDMVSLNTTNWKMASGSSVIFANPNDVDSSCLSQNQGSQKRVYCVSDTSIENHIAEPRSKKSLDATCVDNQMDVTYCFCGKPVIKDETENTALGHDERTVAISYTSGYLENGTRTVECERAGCNYCCESTSANPLIIFDGYSTPENNADRIAVSYRIDKNAVEIYNELSDSDISMGLVVSFTDVTEGTEPVKVVDGVVSANYEKTLFVPISSTYTGVDFILSGFNNGETDYGGTPFVFCAYVVDGENIDYICYDKDYNKVQSEYASLITLNQILG